LGGVKGILRWYTSPFDANALSNLFAAFEASGLSLVNPATGQISLLSEEVGREGEQIPILRVELERRLVSPSRPLTFQLWLEASEDVVCEHRPLKQFVVQSYSFDGLGVEQVQHVIAAVCRHIGAPGIETVALLVDRTSSWEDIDYDQLVLHQIPRRRRDLPASLLVVPR